uniref:polynucleotide adenylyltransferase n=1 Tax=Globodera pallida TaxID=36090 RepID=A0A183CC64_GLOPA
MAFLRESFIWALTVGRSRLGAHVWALTFGRRVRLGAHVWALTLCRTQTGSKLIQMVIASLDAPAWFFTKALSHRQKVMRLYKRCLREVQAWKAADFLECRYECVLMRARFDANFDMRLAQYLLADGCRQLWLNRQPGGTMRYTTFVEEPQFLADKLFAVQNNLDELAAFGPSTSTDCLEKAMEMLTNVKMRRVGKDIDDQVENIPALINHQKDDDVIRITQFGSYKMKTFKNVLIQLHTHMEMLLKKVGTMNIMLKQQQIGNPIICESSQYNLIRTNPANRQNDGHLSNGIVQFITPFCAGEEKNSMIDQIKGQIASVLKKWDPIGLGFVDGEFKRSNKFWAAKIKGSDPSNRFGYPDGFDPDDTRTVLRPYAAGESDTTLYSTLKKDLIGAKLSWIAGKVPLIRIEFGPVELDLLLVPVPIKYLTEKEAAAAKLESDQVIKDICNVKGIYSLAGYRSGKFQLSLVNDKQLFANFLKSIKVWAKNRLIYSGIFGYFNGATLSVMATKICALFPFAPLAYLLYQFFQIYSKWNWPADAVLLDKLSKVSLNVLVNGWPPKFGESSMTVITPKFPEQNAAFNVNKFTLRTIAEEMNFANQILSENGQKWARIFEEVKYAEEFAHFAIILCADVDAQRYATNCGFYRTKIRRNLFEWATATNVSPMLAHYQIIPQSEEKTICNISKNKTPTFKFAANCTFWICCCCELIVRPERFCGCKVPFAPPNAFLHWSLWSERVKESERILLIDLKSNFMNISTNPTIETLEMFINRNPRPEFG